jgi:hypothetical protein
MSATSFSQQKKKWARFGIKLGYCGTTISPGYTSNYGDNHSFRMGGGAIAGGFLQIAASKKIFFQPELLYVYRRTLENFSNTYVSGYSEPIIRGFIEVPLNLLVKLPTKSGFFMLGGGPAPAFTGIIQMFGDNSFKIKMGLIFLLGYQLSSDFSLQLTLTKGLSKYIEPYYQNTLKLTSSSVGLSFGYVF